MFKTRIRQKSKLNNNKFLLALCVTIIFLGTAYSSMSQVLTLGGVFSIKGMGSGGEVPGPGQGIVDGNLDAYISSAQNMWRTGTEWNVSLNIVINNPNDFDTTNWQLVIHAPGITGVTVYNGAQVTIDTAADTGTLTVENSAVGVIPAGGTFTFDCVMKFTNELLESIVDTFSPEELDLIKNKDREIIYGSRDGALTNKLQEAILEHIMYNLAGTPTPNNVVLVATTKYEPEYNLTDFTYTYQDIRFDVTYTYYVRYDSLYVTTAKISATNLSENNISNIGFTMRYNEPLGANQYNSVVSNWGSDGQNNFVEQSNINITEKTSEYVSLNTPAYNAIELAPGQTRNYYISQILTTLKFKSFVFENITYEKDGVLTSLNLDNDDSEKNENITVDNTVVDNKISNTINNNTVNNSVVDNTVNNTVNNNVVNNNTVSDNTVNDNVNTDQNTGEDNTETEKEHEKEPEDNDTGLVIENPITASISYEEQDWGTKVLVATVTLNNSTEKEIKSCTFDLVYNVPVTNLLGDGSVYSSAQMVSQTTERISLKTADWVTIPAAGSITFTVSGIDAANGTSAISIANVVCNY